MPNTRRRRALQLAGLGWLTGDAAAACIPSAPAGKTFVLVHGAWYGGWCWSAVAQSLRAKGHRVSTPTCPGLGEQAHLLSGALSLNTFITTIAQHIHHENLDSVILVGSGFGGVVISGVADRLPQRLQRLVFLDAMVLDSGLSVFDAQPAAVTRQRREQAEREGKGIAIPVPPLSSYAGLDARTLAWLAERLSPQPLGTYEDKLILHHALGNGVPRTYVDCVSSTFAPLATVKQRLKGQPGWDWIDLPAHHDPMIGAPQLVADFLMA